MTRRLRGTMLIACLILTTGGCMKLGPDYQRPAPGISLPETFEHADKMTGDSTLDNWWTAFDNSQIDDLVQTVRRNNPDVRKAAARLMELRALTGSARADRYPSLGAQAQWQQQHQTYTNLLTGAGQRQTVETWSLSLPAAYELDLWGRLTRLEEAARAELLAGEENRRTILQSLTAEAVSAYFQTRSLEERIRITRRSIDTYGLSLDFLEKRYKRGLASVLNVHQARRLLTQAEAGLPQLVQELGLARQKLNLLQGAYPVTRTELTDEEYEFKEPPPVPPALPSELLLRRPDIRAAEAHLQSLNAQIGAAKASRFPSIRLTAAFGFASNDLSTLFDPDSELSSLAAGITQPIFDGGKLAAAQEAAQARYAQGLAEYAKTVLAGFGEVEGALLSRRQQWERRRRLVRFLEEARATQSIAQDHYQRGLTTYLTVLDAQQTRYLAEQNLISADYALLVNHVTLCRALGGGWPVPDEKQVDDKAAEKKPKPLDHEDATQ